jgi:hypothetical protein
MIKSIKDFSTLDNNEYVLIFTKYWPPSIAIYDAALKCFFLNDNEECEIMSKEILLCFKLSEIINVLDIGNFTVDKLM